MPVSYTHLTGVDRAALQQEFQNLQDEIDQIADTTTFNDMKIMNGTYGKKGSVAGSGDVPLITGLELTDVAATKGCLLYTSRCV